MAVCEGPGRVLDVASGSSVEQHGPTSTVKMLLVSSGVGSGWAARVGCQSVSRVTRGLARNAMHRRLSRTPGRQTGADLPSPSVRERGDITYKCEHGEPSRMTTGMPNRRLNFWIILPHASKPAARDEASRGRCPLAHGADAGTGIGRVGWYR